MRYPRRTLLLGAAATLTAALAACSSTPSSTAPGMDHGMSSNTVATTAPDGRAGDVMFAQMMIPHHQQAVQMAEIALAKQDVSGEVRELAEAIKQAQDPEIQTMTAWLAKWEASTTTGGMDHGSADSGMMSQADMEALEQAAGKAFDEQWVSMMIAHHEGAVDMANEVLATTQDSEVRALANAVVKAQTEEIVTMKAMR